LPTAEDVGGPLWWLKRLLKVQADRRLTLEHYNDYYIGKHRLAFATAKFETTFGGLFKEFADNWCELVVSAVEERLNPEGFRIGDETKGDQKAWDIWQRNGLDADSQVAHVEALIYGEAYALVWADELGDPLITVEHPLQMVVAYQPGSRKKRAAALKTWVEDDGSQFATLYLPNLIYKFRSRGVGSALSELWVPNSVNVGGWEPREVAGETNPLVNPLGVVPVVPLCNRPRLLSVPESEIKQVIPKQDAVNKTIADMLVASEFASFRQRWGTGIEIPRDPETGKLIEPFEAGVGRVWTTKANDARFGSFEATDLANFVKAVEMLVQHIASQTRTPPHYFYLSGNFPSGESIKAAETGLVAKASRRMVSFGEAWEEVIRLAFRVANDSRAEVMKSETIWRDPESRSESEHIDAVLKKKALGVPEEQLWEDAGYTPTQISRFKQMRAEQPQPVLPVIPPSVVASEQDTEPIAV
jgi:hypothetical protein